MRKGSTLGITIIVAIIIALIVLVLSTLILGGSLREADMATSQCEQNLGVCIELEGGVCPQGQNLRYTCPQQNQICCSTVRLPTHPRTVSR